MTLHDLKIACPAYKMFTYDGVCERCKKGAIWNVVQHRCIKDSFALSSIIFTETAIQRLLGCYSKGIDRFVVPSRFYLEKFVEWGWPRERFFYAPNFINVDQLQPQGTPGKAFIYFGRLDSSKGLTTFVRAVALAKAKARIVGIGPEEIHLRRLAETEGANIEFLGYRSGEALLEIIRDARAVVLPSEWYENAPMSVMESYALARPVIGSAIGGIPELIREGETGELFPSGNAEALAERMGQFMGLADKAVLEKGEAGRRWMEQNFTPQHYLDRILSLYNEIGVKSNP